MLLPGGHCCCNDCGCTCGKSLPYTMTVEFADLVNETHTLHCPLTFSAPWGSGASAIVMLPGGCDDNEPCCTPSDRGPITEVLLLNGGSCYAKCGRTAPDLIITVDGVTGATFTPSFDTEEIDGLTYWYITGITVSGGEGFVDYTPVNIVPASDSYTFYPANFFLWYDGETASISADAGQYGYYYKEDCSLPGIAAPVTVTPCGGGSGASISATVDTDPTSETFGQITSLSIDNGGTNYLGWKNICRGWYSLNEIPFVLRASEPKRLVTLEFQACYGSGGCATIDNKGPREAPTLTASPACGGTVTPTLTKTTDANGGDVWTISSISASGGTGCPNTAAAAFSCCCTTVEAADVTLNATGGVMTGGTITKGGQYYQQREWGGSPSPIYSVTLSSGGSGYAKLGREEPQWTVTQAGWTFTPTFGTQKEDNCGLPYWEVESFVVGEVTGSFVADGTPLEIAVTGVEKCDIPAEAFIVTKEGVPQSVTVSNGGRYFRENSSLTPHVAAVAVVIQQLPGSSGSGASLTATVEDDTTSANFGKIVGLSLDNGGSGYSLFGAPLDCTYTGGCRSGCVAGSPSVTLQFRGYDKKAIVTLNDGNVAKAVWETTSTLTDCDTLPTATTLLYGSPAGSATITAGGTWDSRGQAGCGDCKSIKDLVADWQNQPVSITSDCPCKGGGTISGSGTIGNLTWGECIVAVIGGVNVSAASAFGITSSDHGCSSTGECTRCVDLSFGSYVYIDDNTTDYVQGTVCGCGDITLGESGFLTGTVTITAVGQQTTCTVTVTLG